MKGCLLMVTGDSLAAAGKEGAFSATLRGFHIFWERIDIVCPYIRSGAIRKPPYPNVFFHSILPFRILSPIYVFLRGFTACRAHKPDLIVAHAYGPQLMACGAWLLSRVTGIPLVLEVHHIDGYPHAANVKEKIFRMASAVFFRFAAKNKALFRVVSAEGMSALRAFGISASKIKLVHSMYIDHSVFYPIAGILKEYDMVFVGRLASNKGLDRLLAVFALVSQKLPSARFLILGSGPYDGWLARQIVRDPHITHIRRVAAPSDVAALYNRSRIAVCASLSEGGPRFMVEAMACGVPVVSARVGVMGEIVREAENGFLADPWSVRVAADCILRILRSGDEYAAYSEHAVRTASRFCYGDAIAAYARAYHDLIDI